MSNGNYHWLVEEAQQKHAELSALRRHIHAHPELSLHEEATARLVLERLSKLNGLSIMRNVGGMHGVVAELDTGKPGPSILIRADMDALPITEQNDVEYCSKNTGVMHACGHDAHVTCLLGLADVLAANKERFKGRVKFLFQPAEEVPPGGALTMIENGGVLDGVDAALALHVDNRIDVGKIGFRNGGVLAYADNFTFTIKGQQSHAALPHRGRDPLPATAQICLALQCLITRETAPNVPRVIGLGMINGGTAVNILADSITVSGTARCVDEEHAQRTPGDIERVISGICAAHGLSYEFDYRRGYPGFSNDVQMHDLGLAAVSNNLGDDAVAIITESHMGGEDFAYFSKRVPSLFLWLGIRNEAKGITSPLHSSTFNIDEDSLPLGVSALGVVAMDFLAQ